MKCKRLGGRRLDLAEEWGSSEFLYVGVEEIGCQLSSQSLSVLAVLNERSSFAQSKQNFELANCLEGISTCVRKSTLVVVLTMGTRPREFDLAEPEPFTGLFTLE